MKKILFSLLIALTLALSVTPAFAQGLGGDRSESLCIGGNSTYDQDSKAKDYSLFGCNGTIKSGATVPGDVAVFGGNLIVEKSATVNGDVAIFGGSTSISGEVKGDVAIMGGAVNLENGAVVDGKVRVLGGAYNASEGATVKGGVNRENGPSFKPPTPPRIPSSASGMNWNPFQSFVSALALAALGMLLIVFFPQQTRRVVDSATAQPLPTFGVGCLTMILVPVLLVFFAITIIGIPVTIVLAIAWAAAMVFGSIAIGYYAGERVLAALKVQHNYAPIIAVFVGVVVLGLLGAVPCVGGLLSFLVATLGLGAVVLTRFGTRPHSMISFGTPAGPAPQAPGGVPPTQTPPAPAQWYTPPQPPTAQQPPYTPPSVPPAPGTPGTPGNPNER